MQANVRNKNNYLYTSEVLKSLNFLINNNKLPIYNNVCNEDTYGEIIGYSANSYIRDDLLYMFVNLKEEAKFIEVCSDRFRRILFAKSKSSAFFDESNVQRIAKLFI